MTEKVYSKEIDRLTTFKLLSENISVILKKKLLYIFRLDYCNIESVYFDIIRPLHVTDNGVLDIYIAGSITSQVDSTKTLSFCMVRRVELNSTAISLLTMIDDAVEIQHSEIPAITSFVICELEDTKNKLMWLISNANEKKCIGYYNRPTFIFNYADNKIYTFIDVAGESDKLSGETKTLITTTYVNPVVIDNAYRLVLEYNNGRDNLREEVFTYNTLA